MSLITPSNKLKIVLTSDTLMSPISESVTSLSLKSRVEISSLTTRPGEISTLPTKFTLSVLIVNSYEYSVSVECFLH